MSGYLTGKQKGDYLEMWEVEMERGGVYVGWWCRERSVMTHIYKNATAKSNFYAN